MYIYTSISYFWKLFSWWHFFARGLQALFLCIVHGVRPDLNIVVEQPSSSFLYKLPAWQSLITDLNMTFHTTWMGLFGLGLLKPTKLASNMRWLGLHDQDWRVAGDTWGYMWFMTVHGMRCWSQMKSYESSYQIPNHGIWQHMTALHIFLPLLGPLLNLPAHWRRRGRQRSWKGLTPWRSKQSFTPSLEARQAGFKSMEQGPCKNLRPILQPSAAPSCVLGRHKQATRCLAPVLDAAC